MPRRGSATTGTREVTSRGSASVVQSTATSRITQPVRNFWRQGKGFVIILQTVTKYIIYLVVSPL